MKLLLSILYFILLPLTIQGQEAIHGVCGLYGDNVVWDLKGDTLFISGKGDMMNYEWASADNRSAPWKAYRKQIKCVFVEDAVTSIGEYVFEFCEQLTSIILPQSLKTIGKGCFWKCTKLESINIPDSVLSIGYYAFYGCTSLSSVKLPKHLTTLESSVFWLCVSLDSILIPENIKTIETGTFQDCTSLRYVQIPNGVTSIGKGAFKGCTSLQTIELPNSIKTLEEAAFTECTALDSIVIPNSVKSLGGNAFDGCTNLKSAKLSEKLTTIPPRAFMNCSSLTSIEFPEGVTMIEGNAFSDCEKLASIIIPKSMTTISWGAFYNCWGIEDVFCYPTTVPEAMHAFDNYMDWPLKVNTTYTYDLHGWQKSRLSQNDQGTHLFSQNLYYADGNGTLQYNGSISSMRYSATNNANSYLGYRYTYDTLGRLTQARYCLGENLSLLDYMHSESTEYDANSNITHFTRNGPTVTTGYGNFDDIYFSYSGNQLRSTYDVGGSQQAAGVFEYRKAALLYQEHYYDGCGAMTADLNKGISHIDYDLNGHPTRIQFINGNVTEYINSADGVKLRTIHRTAVSGLNVPLHQTHTLTAAETMYVDSTTYSGSVEIDQSRNTKWYFGEGYVQQTPSGIPTTYYTIKDYLGNIRKVMKSDGTVVQKQNYYAFGGILNETNNYTDIQTHKYNGKEYDPMHGLNEYDYGARHYDPAIGKFTTIDPLCEKYYHISPYAYCGGNPVNRVDVDGDSIDFSVLLEYDKQTGTNSANNILKDLRSITGLDLYFSSGKLLYNNRFSPEGSSTIARDFIQNAINNQETIAVIGSAYDSHANNHLIKISNSQISKFKLGTPSELNQNTMGYGMVFLHELTHTIVGGNMDDSNPENPYLLGETIQFINKIRKELDNNNKDAQHITYGQRLSHEATEKNGYLYIPFQGQKNKDFYIKYLK